MHEVRDMLNTIKLETQKAGHTQQTHTCATNTIVLIIAMAQVFLFIIYTIYK